MPLSSLPTSKWKDELTDVNVYRRSLPYNSMFTGRPQVDAALVQEFVQRPVFTSSRVRTQAEQETVRATVNVVRKQFETMMEVAQCLVLVDDSPVSVILSWYQPDDTPLFGGAQGGGISALEHIYRFGVTAKDFDQDSVKSLLSNYFRLDKATRDWLRVPLTRLNSSMVQTRTNKVNDAAIDLGIAMEALLTKERDHDAPISYLLRLRGTLLLGGNPDIRRQNYYRIRELYTLRSKAAHGESIAEVIKVPLGSNRGKRNVSAPELLREGTSLCANMIRQIIQRGEIPDWEATVIGW